MWGWKVPGKPTPEEYKRAGYGRQWKQFDPSVDFLTGEEGDDPRRWVHSGKIEVLDSAEVTSIQADADNAERQMFASQDPNEQNLFQDEIDKNRAKWTSLVEGKSLYEARKQFIGQQTGDIKTTAASAGGFGINPMHDWYSNNLAKIKSGEIDYDKVKKFDTQTPSVGADQTGVTEMADPKPFKYPPGSYDFI